MATLINGNGNNAVYAQQDADLYAGALGESTRILNVGSKLAYTIEDANTIAVADGVILTKEGRRIQVDVGSVDEFTIPTGSAGVTRYYIIGYHLYTDGSANQKCETFVQLMASESETIPEAEFREGATEVYVSLYRIKQIGLNLDTITALLSVGIALTDMTDVIGDTDISGIGDGTLTGGLNAVNQNLTEIMMRYNPTTDYIQIEVDGTWKNWKRAYMNSLVIWNDGQYGEGFSKGNNALTNSGYTSDGGYTISGNAIQITCPSTKLHCRGSFITPAIDLSTYSQANIVYNDGSSHTSSIDLSGVSASGTLYLTLLVNGSDVGLGAFGFSSSDSSAITPLASSQIQVTKGRTISITSILLE